MLELLEHPTGLTQRRSHLLLADQRRAKPWWRTHKDMDMIDVRFQCQQGEAMPLTALRKQAFGFRLYLPVSILRRYLGIHTR